MFSAFLKERALWQPILGHPVLRESLAWLESRAAAAGEGDHPLGEPGWYANIHGYRTQPEADCLWENHRATIDIQYLISGCEGIRFEAVSLLGSPRRYLADADREEFDPPRREASLVTMLPGRFAIFLPGDAHCPKVALDLPVQLRKAVVKIPLRLLGEVAR